MDTIELVSPFDAHFHPRRGKMLENVLASTAQSFSRGIAMPNTSPAPILTAEMAVDYRAEIHNLCCARGFQFERRFEPLMTIMITLQTTPEMIRQAKEAGVIAGKFYPKGLTTNSENGFDGLDEVYPALEAMQEVDMVASFHPESPLSMIGWMEKEQVFLGELESVVMTLPKLRIVAEHITTRWGVDWVKGMPARIVATIMPHYLYLVADHVLGYAMESKGRLQPYWYCKPVPKTWDDRAALREAVISGNPKFFFGSDSAAHDVSRKICADPSPGIFIAPVALASLAQIFEDCECLDRLQGFVSDFGRKFYGLPQDGRIVRLVRRDWKVPETINGIVPFMAGETLRWRVAE